MAMEPSEPGIVQRPIEEEMRTSYIDYAMSVIVGRALPRVEDGLKPVHRRILHAMNEMNLTSDRPYRKSATMVGEVLGKFHPHGDVAIYDALVRMAQPWSLRYPLVDGRGNFGSIDGDNPAAMRYTEARLTPIANELLDDIKLDTVDWTDNFDGSQEEPLVLPGRLPNLLVNGSTGIAVGMATSIPSHNLGEVVDALLAVLDDPELPVEELIREHLPGPDFPTGGVIYGRNGIYQGYMTGRGVVRVRARTHLEETNRGHPRIVVDEIPYMVNKSKLLEDIASLVREKRVQDISDLRDESDRDGLRIVIDLKRDALPDIVLNHLFQHTQMQSSISILNLAIVDGEPRVLTIRGLLDLYLDHRREVIRRRTQHLLKKAQARAHILEGLQIALDHLDAVIELIRGSPDTPTARQGLQDRFELTAEQAKAVTDLTLGRLTGLEVEKILDELESLRADIERYRTILGDPEEVTSIIRRELGELRETYGDERRTDIVEDEGELLMEDLIPDEPVVVFITDDGYIKRMTLDAYRTQRRGGRGLKGIETKEEDHVVDVFTTTNHKPLLIITDAGVVFSLKTYEIPEGSRQSKGRPIVNLIERLDPDEGIQAAIPIAEWREDHFLFFATRGGKAKKTPLSEYEHINVAGKYAIKLEEGDRLVGVTVTSGSHDILLIKSSGKGVRFNEAQVRATGRYTFGVKGTTLRRKEEVIAMVPVRDPEADLLTITKYGKGKRTPLATYRTKNRGIQGQYMQGVDDATGPVVGALEVTDEDQLILTTQQGIIIRISAGDISRMQTAQSRGVYIQRLDEGDEIVAVAKIVATEEPDDDAESEDDGPSDGGGADDQATDEADVADAKASEG